MDIANTLDAIFKAYDIRGKVGSELTPEVMQRIGQAFAEFLPTKGAVAVGFDMRPDSSELASNLIKGILATGRDVVDIGQVTSDMIYFATGHYQLAGGAMITASHNPGEYNGVKLCREEAKPIGIESGLIDIKSGALTISASNTAPSGRVDSKDVLDDWIAHVTSFITPAEMTPLSIVVDAGNGMAGATFPSLAKQLPLTVHEMYFEPDGTFPNHIANPLEPANLADIQSYISQHSVAAGIAFDGDGDRAVLLDETGAVVSGTQLTALLANYFLDKQPQATILYNAICGRDVSDLISARGAKAYRTKVGHSYIKADMRTYDALFAGEHSGHYYFRDNFCADSGLIAATIALFVLATQHKPLSQLAAQYKHYVQIPETNFTVEDKSAVLQKIKDHFKNEKYDELDGITVWLPNGWINIRASNTEPLLRLNAEATSQAELSVLVAQATALITG